ncbi:MAG: hypothetical protein ABIP74_00330 [Candidatus Saccharimonas sp.]
MSPFVFETYNYVDGIARFSYRYGKLQFIEEVSFTHATNDYNRDALERALFLAFVLIGTSYYKCFPTSDIVFEQDEVDQWQAEFFRRVYTDGLSQFAYENHLDPMKFAIFNASLESAESAIPYEGSGDIVMQSGGKDSLLLAVMLQREGRPFTPWYSTTSDDHPLVLDDLSEPLVTSRRVLDHERLKEAGSLGALNGHVPVTYILSSIALLQAILIHHSRVLMAIGHEGEEPHAFIGDVAVRHQWSKTLTAEQEFAKYVKKYISPDLAVFSPLRRYSELRIAELFVEQAWEKYGHQFSSCNIANYMQGHTNTTLAWCGNCPKCANSYLLFAPFLDASELKSLFGEKDLFVDPELDPIFRGLLGIEGAMKPFECVGEIDELRRAYHMAQARGGYGALGFAVPDSDFDYKNEYIEDQEDV